MKKAIILFVAFFIFVAIYVFIAHARLPPGWSQMKYGGSGEWELTNQNPPPGFQGYYLAASGRIHPTDVFDVECFTPPMNMSGETKVYIHVHAWMWDYGWGELTVYSGGIGDGYEEKVLWIWFPGDPVHHIYATINPSNFEHPEEVYLGFYFSSDGMSSPFLGLEIDKVDVHGKRMYMTEDFDNVDFNAPHSWIVWEIDSYKNYVSPYTEFTIFSKDENDYEIYFRIMGPEESKFYWYGNYYKCNEVWRSMENTPVAFQIRNESGHNPEGIYTVEFYAVDSWGNVEEKHTIKFIFDNLPPNTHCEFETHDGFISLTTPIYLISSDSGSGVDRIYYRIDNGNWEVYRGAFNIKEHGFHVISFYGIDKVGNREKERRVELNVDAYPPETQIEGNMVTINGMYWMRGGDKIGLFANDGESGVKATYMRIDGKKWKKYVEPFSLEEGKHEISFYSEDNAGNREEEKHAIVRVDSSPPQIKILTPQQNNLYIYGRKFAIPFSFPVIIGKMEINGYAIDDCKVGRVAVYIDGKIEYVSDGKIDFSWNKLSVGKHTITIEASDILSNKAYYEISAYIFNLI